MKKCMLLTFLLVSLLLGGCSDGISSPKMGKPNAPSYILVNEDGFQVPIYRDRLYYSIDSSGHLTLSSSLEDVRNSRTSIIIDCHWGTYTLIKYDEDLRVVGYRTRQFNRLGRNKSVFEDFCEYTSYKLLLQKKGDE